MNLKLCGQEISVDVIDEGVGIADVQKAMEPLYTTKADKDRSGMGFTFMEAFMDELSVESQVGKGTIVHMKKKIGR
jgi:stage II sporulation protein AB (anti-sigma F factor)